MSFETQKEYLDKVQAMTDDQIRGTQIFQDWNLTRPKVEKYVGGVQFTANNRPYIAMNEFYIRMLELAIQSITKS